MTPTSDPYFRLIGKIQKLLALTKSENRNEAEVAVKQAHKLMAKHGLTLKQVLEAGESGIYELKLPGRKWLEIWRFGLLTACAWSNDCHTIRVQELAAADGKMLVIAHILGKQEKTEAAHYLYCYFEQMLEKEARERVISSEIVGSVALNSWRLGATIAIQDRILRREGPPSVELERRALEITRTSREQNRQAAKEHVKKEYRETFQPRMHALSTDYTAKLLGGEYGRSIPIPSGKEKKINSEKSAEKPTEKTT